MTRRQRGADRDARARNPASLAGPNNAALNNAVFGRHRFTEPTPVAGRSGPVVSVFVADWEIECCAPPPTVGEIGRWRLGFRSAEQSRDPAFNHRREWRWAPWPYPSSRSCCLSAGPIKVYWPVPDEAPTGERIRLRGRVFGTKHGGTGWDDFPVTTGLVTRVRLVTSDFALNEPNSYYRVVPGTTTLVDVDRSPKQFPSVLIPDESGSRTSTHGVVIDLIHHQ